MCKCAPALLTLRDQIDARWPHRSKASDGCCASSAHHRQNPASDHEPDASGFAHAFDVTADPAHGVNGDVLVSLLMLDTRVKYLIWNRRIWFPLARVGGRKAGWSAYTGPNPHTKHVHCSIVATATHDTRPWPLGTTAPQEDDMTPEQDKRLRDLEAAVKAIGERLGRMGLDNGRVKVRLGIGDQQDAGTIKPFADELVEKLKP